MAAARGIAAVTAALLCVLGCNAILGLSDPVDPVPSNDATAGGDGPTGDGDVVDACTTDAAGDPLNCGTCGHDCQGGDCLGGVCAPVLLAESGDRISSITLAGPKIYWSVDFVDGGGVVTSALLDGGLKKTNTGVEPSPQFLTTADGNVFFTTSDDKVHELQSGAEAVVANAPGGCSMSGLAVSLPYFFFSCTGLSQVLVSILSGTPSELTAATAPRGAAYSAGRVFFLSGGHIQSVSADGGSPSDVAPAMVTGVRLLLTDTANIYWIENAQTIESAPLGGSFAPPTVGASGQALELALGNGNVYWTDGLNGGGIFSAPLPATGLTTELPIPSTAFSTPGPIAVDSKSIYWGNKDGRLMKIAIPP